MAHQTRSSHDRIHPQTFSESGTTWPPGFCQDSFGGHNSQSPTFDGHDSTLGIFAFILVAFGALCRCLCELRVGLRSETRTSNTACWASWGLSMVQRRHPHVAAALVTEFEGSPTSPFLQAASQSRADGKDVPPSWHALARGERHLLKEPENREPGTSHRGWQHGACTHVEGEFRAKLFTRVRDQARALVRSHAGPGASAALMVTSTNGETTIPSHLFRVVLLRRLRHAFSFLWAIADVVHLILVATGQLVRTVGCLRRVCFGKHHGAHLQGSRRPCART